MTASSYQVSILVLLASCIRQIAAAPLGNVVYVTSEDLIWETVAIIKTIVLCSTTLGESTSPTRVCTTTSLRPCTSSSASYGYGPWSPSSTSISRNTATTLAISSGYVSSSSGFVASDSSSVSQISVRSLSSIWCISLPSMKSKQYSLKLVQRYV